jgi:hypothetical protein
MKVTSSSTETPITGVLIKAEQTAGILSPSEVNLLTDYIEKLEDENEKLMAKLGQAEDNLQSAEAELETRPPLPCPYSYDDL